MNRIRHLPCLIACLLLLLAAEAFPGDVGPLSGPGETGAESVRPAEEGVQPVVPAAVLSNPDSDPGGDPFQDETPSLSIADPLEPINRAVFVFNDKAYYWVMKPVARGYRAVVPEIVRISVRNFFSNLTMPIRFANNLLQGKFRNSGVELIRFAINTTAGIGGFFDPAKDDLLLQPRNEDLGQTFGTYGLGHGFYIVLPILGPSSLRDATGLAGDSFLDPVNYAGESEVVAGIKTFKAVNDLSLRIGEYEDLTRPALDPYVAVRDAYTQYRAKEVDR